MAAITHAVTATWSTNAGTTTAPVSTAFTPAAGDLLVVVAASSGLAGGTTTVTDDNTDGQGAYVQVDVDRTGFSTTGVLTVWVRTKAIGSATSTVVTAPQNTSSGGGLDVYRVSGMYKVGAAAVRSNGGQSTGTLGTTPAPVLSLTPLTGNPIITAVCNGSSPGGVAQQTSYTEPTNLGYATPTTGLDTAFINSGITNATITWGSTSATAFASVAIELDTSIQVGPVFRQKTFPVRERIPSPYTRGLQGRCMRNPGGPVSNPTSGPVTGWSGPAGVRAIPVRTGIAMATLIPKVTAVPPPLVGPPVYALHGPVRARLGIFPQPSGNVFAKLAAGTGNISGPVSGSSPGGGMGCTGAPVRNPTSGPAFIQRRTPVRFIIPNWQPRAGRIGSSFGAPVINPRRGPPFFPQRYPIQATDPLPRRGRVYGINGNGAPVQNPITGPVFHAQRYPIAAVDPLPRKGRVGSNPGSAVTVTPPPSGPRAYALARPVQARVPQAFLKGRIRSNAGSPVRK